MRLLYSNIAGALELFAGYFPMVVVCRAMIGQGVIACDSVVVLIGRSLFTKRNLGLG